MTDSDSWETLYVAASRARQRTDLYLAIEDERLEVAAASTDSVEMLRRVLSTSAGATSSIRRFAPSKTVAPHATNPASHPQADPNPLRSAVWG